MQFIKSSLNKDGLLASSIQEAIQIWLSTLSPLTRKNYSSGMNMLLKHGILDSGLTVKGFGSFDHSSVLSQIKNLQTTKSGDVLSEATRQARAACYISFTKCLSRLTDGLIRVAYPCRDFGFETFYKIRDSIKKNIISKNQWLVFFESLKRVSYRDYLIGKIITHGIRKPREVISLRLENLVFEQNKICFRIKKRKNRVRDVHITYPISIMDELRTYINCRTGWVFVSPSGKQVHINQVYYFFDLAQRFVKFPFRITPDVLRASALAYLRNLGFSDRDIMRVSGHSCVDTISSYDIFRSENISSQLPLIF